MTSQTAFTGGSGRFLDQSLERAGLAKADIFTTNVVHCHPPKNRPSLLHEVANCRPYLVREFVIINPKLAVGLGRDAVAALRGLYPQATEILWPFPLRQPTKPTTDVPELLSVQHPSWIKYQPMEARDEYVASLARALKWAFRG